jgi:hypothetical protein
MTLKLGGAGEYLSVKIRRTAAHACVGAPDTLSCDGDGVLLASVTLGPWPFLGGRSTALLAARPHVLKIFDSLPCSRLEAISLPD